MRITGQWVKLDVELLDVGDEVGVLGAGWKAHAYVELVFALILVNGLLAMAELAVVSSRRARLRAR
jgi:hypothetical protein